MPFCVLAIGCFGITPLEGACKLLSQVDDRPIRNDLAIACACWGHSSCWQPACRLDFSDPGIFMSLHKTIALTVITSTVLMHAVSRRLSNLGAGLAGRCRLQRLRSTRRDKLEKLAARMPAMDGLTPVPTLLRISTYGIQYPSNFNGRPPWPSRKSSRTRLPFPTPLLLPVSWRAPSPF